MIDAADAAAAGAPRVLLAIADPVRREQLRSVLDRVAPHCRVDFTERAIDAVLRATRSPADLLVLDLDIGDVAGPALVRHMARVAPATVVLAFDENPERHPAGGPRLWGWGDAETALRHWLAGRARRAGDAA